MIYKLHQGVDREWKKKAGLAATLFITLTIPVATAFAVFDSPDNNEGTYGVNGITVTRGPLADNDNPDTTDPKTNGSGSDSGGDTTTARAAQSGDPAAGSSGSEEARQSSASSDTDANNGSSDSYSAPERGGQGGEGPTAGGDGCACETLPPDAPTPVEELLGLTDNQLIQDTADTLGL